ncbi:hypothetical protein BEL04_08780 [Mucilaginibacter sp. PPCGB 2223]|uniref:S1/P1 nuclease n=1 Tax=Mucilaginibacter sp. PPCGB 2223 TaxID=1886027 RepID=UPI00082694EE|nr:S1/P1 nuclease [Mucilaginibacter sp. PPCGB 2223]OCX54342.1 hypothetical protein BEL04_08780 [Mucilaginibacter sp. PPCGB 2223]
MKKLIWPVAAIALILVSWGGVGHKTVATIAENHLNTEAKISIKALLGDQSIADIASWADEVRNTPEYKSTGPLHYVDLPLGYTYDQFAAEVKKQGSGNVYGAILKYETELQSDTTRNEEKAIALKFLVHFIGDCHQPMHVSRAEDKGGNDIKVQFNGRNTNLHSLWDSGLISREGKSFDQMAKDYDNASQDDIIKWTGTDPMTWLWESYQFSTKIYGDVEKNNTLDEEYYKANIPIVQQRIEMAGIRLAGELNKIFSQYPVKGVVTHIGTPMSANLAKEIDIKDAAQHMNEWVSITAQAYSSRSIGEMTLVNLGAAYPNQLLTIVLKEGVATLKLDGKNITVKGKVIEYKGKPEIEVTDAQQITVH